MLKKLGRKLKAQASPDVFIADLRDASTIKKHLRMVADMPWKKQTSRVLTDFMTVIASTGHTHGPGKPKRTPIANRQEASTIKKYLGVLAEMPWKKQTRRALTNFMTVIASTGHTHGPGKPKRTPKAPAL